MSSMYKPVSGATALAQGAIESDVSLVTGYPGAPATAVVNHILDLTSPDEVQVEWTSNEKVAIEMAFGASVGGGALTPVREERGVQRRARPADGL